MILPILMLVDTSGSMFGDKITILNNCIKNMIQDFGKISHVDVSLAIITYASCTKLHQPFKIAKEIEWKKDLVADGQSNLGDAFQFLNTLMSNKIDMLKNAYQPEIILISDGTSTDDWQKPLDRLLQKNTFRLANRHALFIGNDDGLYMLKDFVSIKENLFKAYEHLYIKDFFTYIKRISN